jgi:cbb3-type cytochrome oxidase subunit 3
MIKDVLKNFPYELMPTLVMMGFVLFFVAMVIWVFRKDSSEVYKHAESLPFSDEEKRS